MELTPIFKVTANGTDVTGVLQKNMLSLSIKDEDGTLSDELTLKVIGLWKRPRYRDELKVWLGYKETSVAFMGAFKVQTTERENNNILTITATGVDFGETLKEKKDKAYKDTNLKAIATEIASRHKLNVKSDCEDIAISYIAQHDQSDLAFMKKIADRYNLIFSVKNNTLTLLKRVKDEKKSSTLPSFVISAEECENLRIRHSNKTMYMSAKAVWRDTKENQDKEVKTNDAKPQLRINGSFKDSKEAISVAKARLEKANRGTKDGSLTTTGKAIFAGGKLNLVGSIEDDGEYSIKSVQHEFNDNGWTTSIEFEN